MIKISIIVPCYQHAQFLDEALRSVLEQSFTDWECIIINDGSTDETQDVANQWTTRDVRFKYVHQENQGLSAARNTGISLAKGHYILPLDADDKISIDYVRLAISEFEKNNALKVVYCNAEYFGHKTGIWQLNPYSYYDLLRYNSIFCSAVFKIEDWRRVGGYDTQLKYGLEDWEFWIHLLKEGGEVLKLDHLGFFYRIKSESMINSMTQEQIKYSQNYVFNKHSDTYYSNYDELLKYRKRLSKQLKSKKYVLNLFTKRFFGFTIFKK